MHQAAVPRQYNTVFLRGKLRDDCIPAVVAIEAIEA